MPDDGRRVERQHLAGWQQLWRAAGYGPSLALSLLGASLVTLALLSLRIREHRPPSWDGQGLRFLAPHRHGEPVRSTLDVFAEVGSEYRGLLLACLLVLGLVVLRQMRTALLCTLVVGTSLATVTALKPAFHRPPLMTSNEGYFPSGHAAGSFAVGAVLVLLAWPTRWRWPVLAATAVLLALYGAALVYSRSHYPSDVVGGWCVALVWTCAFALLVSKGDLRSGRELSLIREGSPLGHPQDDEELPPGAGAVPLREE
jgi:membrane-associated phospholipid phosphatase